MSSQPRVSVIIPTFNAAQFIAEAIHSVLRQTYANFEVIVVDDGSTDDTRSRLRLFGPRIKYLHQQQAGVSAARNHGVRVARGSLIAFLDADDWWAEEKLASQVECLDCNPAAGAVLTLRERVDVRGQSLHLDHAPPPGVQMLDLEAVLGRFRFQTSCLMVRRSVVAEVGGFDESLETAGDLDFILRISMRHLIAEVRTALVKHRIAEGTLSSRVFTGNRLRVLHKLLGSRVGEKPRIRRLARRKLARVHLDYAEDLLWHSRPLEACGQALKAVRHRWAPSALTLWSTPAGRADGRHSGARDSGPGGDPERVGPDATLRP